MIKKILLILCLVLTSREFSFAQVYINQVQVNEYQFNDTTFFNLDSIKISGNKKTKAVVILRELLFSKNEPVSIKQIIAAQKRVQSLDLFTRVRFEIVSEKESCLLNIFVNERWYIVIYPTFYQNENSLEKISYGLSLRHYNFLGKNIYLKLKTVHGYNPSHRVIFNNPWFMKKLKLYANLKLYKRIVKSKSPELREFEDVRIGISSSVGKRFGHFTFGGVDFNYTQITAPRESGLTVSHSGKDKLLSVALVFKYDNRDLKEYPHKGWWMKSYMKIAGHNKMTNYHQLGIDVRRFIPVTRKITLALRTASLLSSPEVPIYDRAYLGYEERIRGRFYNIFEGENLVLGNTEIRFPLIKIRYFNFPIIPRFKRYTSNLKLGLSGAVFFDTGAIWFHNQKISRYSFKSGFGAGLHLHLPYIDLLRLECGITPQWDVQGIVDVDLAF